MTSLDIRIQRANRKAESVRRKAVRAAIRSATLAHVNLLESEGLTRSLACFFAGRRSGVHARTVWRWLEDFFDKPMEER